MVTPSAAGLRRADVTARGRLADRVRHRLAESGTGVPGNGRSEPSDGWSSRGSSAGRLPANVEAAGRSDAGDGFDGLVRREAGGIADDMVVDRLRREVRADLHGAGPLEPLLADPAVSDVLVNAPDSVWVDRGEGPIRVDVGFADEAEVRALACRLAVAAGRRLDDAAPFADLVLPDGTRLHAALPPLVPATTLSLRVLGRRRLALADLVAGGSVAEPAAALLRDVVAARLALVITGGTGTGKTTLLAALLAECGAGERIVTIEDARELAVGHPHVIGLVTRVANIEGAGEVGLRELVRQALRMRPDRLVVGELRGAEMVDLLVALNTGHEGGAATLHANSAADVPARFAALGGLAGLGIPAITSLVASGLDLVVHLRRDRSGSRRLAELAVLSRDGDALTVGTAWTDTAGDGPAMPALLRLLDRRLADAVPTVAPDAS